MSKCKLNQVKLGYPYLYRRIFTPWIINFPTKNNWRSRSNLDDIISGLEYLTLHYKEWGIESRAEDLIEALANLRSFSTKELTCL